MIHCFNLISILNSVDILNKKEIIAYPTETVFGIGCDPDSKTAVNRLLKLKKRPIEKGLILIGADFNQLKTYIDDSILSLRKWEKIFSPWKKPITFVFPAKKSVPFWLTGKFNSIAIRVTNHPVVTELCRAFGKPIISTSANFTKLPPCRTVQEIQEQFGNSISIINGKISSHSCPSEIRDALTGKKFR